MRPDAISKRTGIGAVYLKVKLNTQKVVLSTGVFCLPTEWDQQRQRIITDDQVSSDKNLILQNCLAKATNIFTEFRLLEVTLSPEKFKELYHNITSRKDFIQYYEYELNKRQKRGEITQSTFKSHNNTLNKLKLYSKNKELPFSALDEKFIKNFDSWHRKHLERTVERLGKVVINNSLNTRHIALKNIKTYLRLAAKDESIKVKDPFTGKMPVTQVRGSKVYLTKEELRQLINLYQQSTLHPTTRGVLCRFLCSCFTSIRISDHKRLFDAIKEDALLFKPLKTQRTQKEVRIPLNKLSRYFISELQKENYQLISDQKTNQQLKIIAGLAGIDKRITMHVARHTFASQFLLMGGQPHILQQIMGHANYSTTEVYVHLSNDDAANQIKLMDGLANDLLP